jgi:hypothetical protein
MHDGGALSLESQEWCSESNTSASPAGAGATHAVVCWWIITTNRYVSDSEGGVPCSKFLIMKLYSAAH